MNEGGLSTRGGPSTWLVAALGAAVLWACSEGPPPAPPPDAGPAPRAAAGEVAKVKGEVKLEREGKAQPALPGPLFLKDALETGADGEAEVHFSGGRVVEVGPDARLVIEEGQGGLVLNVDRGLVLSRVPGGAAATGQELALFIDTPFGLTRVGKSEVSVDVGKDETRLEVKLGQVEFVGKDGQVTQAAAGEKKSFDNKPRTLELPAIKFVLTATGRVELKKKDAKAYTAVSAKKPVEVEEGDAVRVREGKASLGGGGASSVVLARGSEAVVGATSSSAGAESTALSLNKGELSAVLDPKKRSTLKVNELGLTAQQGAQLSVAKVGDGYQLEVVSGEVSVEREGEAPQTVAGGSVARISKKGVDVAQVPKDTVQLPTRPGLKVFHSGLPRVSLFWEAEEGKAYRVEVSNDPSYAQPIVSGLLKQHYLSLTPPARGNLFWRVLDGDKEVEHGSAFFSPEPKAGELDLNRNQVLDGADKTTIFFQDRPPAVTFVCKADPKAARYRVSVYHEGQLTQPVAETTGEGERVALKEGALAEGRYLWSATPLDEKGQPLAGGKMNKLEITYDNAVPNLIIKAPHNGDPGGAQVPVVGIAPVGSKLFVNGKAVALDEKARFDTISTPLPGGKMVFRLVKGGSEVYTVRTLRAGR